MAASLVQPALVAAVAMHGTGTPLGDPIEVGALGQALGGSGGSVGRPLLLLSNKACFGHTEGAAGVSGKSSGGITAASCRLAPNRKLGW